MIERQGGNEAVEGCGQPWFLRSALSVMASRISTWSCGKTKLQLPTAVGGAGRVLPWGSCPAGSGPPWLERPLQRRRVRCSLNLGKHAARSAAARTSADRGGRARRRRIDPACDLGWAVFVEDAARIRRGNGADNGYARPDPNRGLRTELCPDQHSRAPDDCRADRRTALAGLGDYACHHRYLSCAWDLHGRPLHGRHNSCPLCSRLFIRSATMPSGLASS